MTKPITSLRKEPIQQEARMARTGFIDHIGIAVPDLAAAKRYYDELMPILGLRQWFKTGPEGPLNYGPDGARGTQVFFYQAVEGGAYSRHVTGLQHIAFVVASRAIVREAYNWARDQNAVVLDEPQEFPEYGQHYATYWLDPHGFKLEAVCFNPEGVTAVPPSSAEAG
jgi:catechol 2,3-dioxygenase-like lactoylglutathione lyase family enzyme